MNTRLSNRSWQILIGVLLLTLALTGSLGFFWGIVGFFGGSYLLYRNLNSVFQAPSTPRDRRGTRDEREEGAFTVTRSYTPRSNVPRSNAPRSERPVPSATFPFDLPNTAAPLSDRVSVEGVFNHAEAAMRAAGIDPETTPVLPTDIGLMAINVNEEPVVYRTTPVLDSAAYVQPFVSLRLKQRAVGRVRFEISDADDQTLFVHEEIYQLRSGDNLLTPAARLRLHDAQNRHTGWHLRISADGVSLADHRFAWEEDGAQVLRRHLSGDGEISDELRQMMAENRLSGDRVSLDDLLGDQDEADSQTRGTRRT